MREEYRFWVDDENPEGVETVEFKLIYRGRLPAVSRNSTRSREKHEIRKVFHRQLREFWSVQPYLSKGLTKKQLNTAVGKEPRTPVEVMADRYARVGYRFVPLITESRSLGAELDILFLRRDAPGKVVSSAGGDLDNRLKVLFDAFRIPLYDQEVVGFAPEADEDPFFILLEDDSLISKITVSTDRLLTPLESDESINDVHLIIGVRVKVFFLDTNFDGVPFL